MLVITDKIFQLKELAINKAVAFCSEHILENLSMILVLSTLTAGGDWGPFAEKTWSEIDIQLGVCSEEIKRFKANHNTSIGTNSFGIPFYVESYILICIDLGVYQEWN